MSVMDSFPLSSPDDFITAFEMYAELENLPADEIKACKVLQNLRYPKVLTPQEQFFRAPVTDKIKSPFIVEEKKQLWHVWQFAGAEGVYEEVKSRLQNPNDAESSLYKIALRGLGCLAKIVHFASTIASSALTQAQREEILFRYSKTYNWPKSSVRCLAWHKHCEKFAIGYKDNAIKIYDCQRTDIIPLLKHKQQTCITDLAWKPFSASVLAVACSHCVLVWTVEPTSLSARPPSSAAVVLHHNGVGPITSISWDPEGGLLAVASPSDNFITLWDVSVEMPVSLCKIDGQGIPFLTWSLDGCKLLSTSCTNSFRIWQCQKWTNDKWSHLAGRCTCACWSPDGSTLLFTTAERPVVYYIRFRSDIIAGDNDALAAQIAIDVSEVEVDSEFGPTRIGGLIHSMVWDPNGCRLVIQFAGSGALALFQTTIDTTFDVLPIGFIKGPKNETASVFTFKPNFDRGSLLTVAWSGGSVSYVPLFYETLAWSKSRQQTGNGHALIRHA